MKTDKEKLILKNCRKIGRFAGGMLGFIAMFIVIPIHKMLNAQILFECISLLILLAVACGVSTGVAKLLMNTFMSNVTVEGRQVIEKVHAEHRIYVWSCAVCTLFIVGMSIFCFIKM